jgi:dTDP-4-dehydrorhamnose reductase
MKTIIVLGASGMLGKYMVDYLVQKYPIIFINRDRLDAEHARMADIAYGPFQSYMEPGVTLINCIGMIKPQVDKYGTLAAIRVNSVFPHLLSEVCEKRKVKMFHITTDCVFSGNDGRYVESSPHDAADVYGRTKSLGEPTNCMNLRTSIIGEEANKRSLLEWVRSNAGKTINGYGAHEWNGVTCLQLAKVVEFLIENDIYEPGIRHIFTDQSISKFQLVQIINDVYKLGITVTPVETKKCDRTLRSELSPLNITIPTIPDQIAEQAKFRV